MRTVGIIATSVVGLGVLAGIVVAVRELPDLRRYLRIRSM